MASRLRRPAMRRSRRAAPAPARSARPRRRSGTRRSPFGWMKQMSWPAAPLRMPPGAKRTPLRARASRRRARRSSTHRPTWLSGGSCTAGLPSGSIGCIRSTSTACEPAPTAQMSSSTFSRSLRNCRSTARPSRSTQSARRRALLGAADRDLLHAEDAERTLAGRAHRCLGSPRTRGSPGRPRGSRPSLRDDLARPRRRARRRGCSPSSSPRSRRAARRRAPPGPAAPRRRPAGPASARAGSASRSGGGLNGISASSSAARGDSTRASTLRAVVRRRAAEAARARPGRETARRRRCRARGSSREAPVERDRDASRRPCVTS